MTSMLLLSAPAPILKYRPIGFSRPNEAAAIDALITATAGRPSPSPSEKSRPAANGVPTVAKYPGDTVLTKVRAPEVVGQRPSAGRPSTVKVSNEYPSSLLIGGLCD